MSKKQEQLLVMGVILLLMMVNNSELSYLVKQWMNGLVMGAGLVYLVLHIRKQILLKKKS